MREISVFEAKARLGTILDWVEQGEEIVITRFGKAVARLVPSRPQDRRDDARAAARSIREMSRGVTLGIRDVKGSIEEGRV